MRPQSEEEYRDEMNAQALSEAEQEAIAAQAEHEQEEANRQSLVSNPIFVKRSVSEKLPDISGRYFIYEKSLVSLSGDYSLIENGAWFNIQNKSWRIQGDLVSPEYWFEQMELEEYLKELGLKAYIVQEMPVRKESRCCGRCDGVNDICVTDTECDTHKELGCEICFGPR